MSKISYKLANKIAVAMAGDLFNVRIKWAEELLNVALTNVARQVFPREVFRFIALYPRFIDTTNQILVKGIDGGKYKNVIIDGRIDFRIPVRSFIIEVDDKTILFLKDLAHRKSDLYERRAKTCNEIAERIHECRTVARLKREFSEAYEVMLSIKSTEKE